MIRKAPAVVGATVAGLVGLLSFHTHATTVSGGTATGTGSGSATGTGTGSGPGSATGTGPSSSTGGGSGPTGSGGASSTSAGPSGSGPSGRGASGSGSAGSGSGSAGARSSGAPPSSSTPVTTSATGPVVQYGYGQLAVSVKLSGGRITGVTVPTLQVADPTSQYIAQQVFPMLKRQVLSAQSANISGVTGATYTSEAYAKSLQSALTKARHP